MSGFPRVVEEKPYGQGFSPFGTFWSCGSSFYGQYVAVGRMLAMQGGPAPSGGTVPRPCRHAAASCLRRTRRCMGLPVHLHDRRCAAPSCVGRTRGLLSVQVWGLDPDSALPDPTTRIRRDCGPYVSVPFIRSSVLTRTRATGAKSASARTKHWARGTRCRRHRSLVQRANLLAKDLTPTSVVRELRPASQHGLARSESAPHGRAYRTLHRRHKGFAPTLKAST